MLYNYVSAEMEEVWMRLNPHSREMQPVEVWL